MHDTYNTKMCEFVMSLLSKKRMTGKDKSNAYIKTHAIKGSLDLRIIAHGQQAAQPDPQGEPPPKVPVAETSFPIVPPPQSTPTVVLNDGLPSPTLTANNPATEVAANNRIRGGLTGDQGSSAAARSAGAEGVRGTGLQRSQERLAAASGEASATRARL